MAYRSRTVTKPKKDKVRLPDYMTRTVVIWGLKEEEKQAAFVQDIISIHARITKITIIKRKPAIKGTWSLENAFTIFSSISDHR